MSSTLLALPSSTPLHGGSLQPTPRVTPAFPRLSRRFGGPARPVDRARPGNRTEAARTSCLRPAPDRPGEIPLQMWRARRAQERAAGEWGPDGLTGRGERSVANAASTPRAKRAPGSGAPTSFAWRGEGRDPVGRAASTPRAKRAPGSGARTELCLAGRGGEIPLQMRRARRAQSARPGSGAPTNFAWRGEGRDPLVRRMRAQRISALAVQIVGPVLSSHEHGADCRAGECFRPGLRPRRAARQVPSRARQAAARRRQRAVRRGEGHVRPLPRRPLRDARLHARRRSPTRSRWW